MHYQFAVKLSRSFSLKTTPLRIPSKVPNLSVSALRARLLQAFGYSSLNKGLRIRPQRCCQSDWAGMVSASEVEEALKQRLEAKDVVGVRNTVQCINPMQYLRVVLRCRRLWTIRAGELL